MDVGADEGPTAPSARNANPLEPADFWSLTEALPRIDPPTERPDLSLLRRLGPFTALDDDLVARLGPTYRAVAAAAEAALEAADTAPATEEEDTAAG